MRSTPGDNFSFHLTPRDGAVYGVLLFIRAITASQGIHFAIRRRQRASNRAGTWRRVSVASMRIGQSQQTITDESLHLLTLTIAD